MAAVGDVPLEDWGAQRGKQTVDSLPSLGTPKNLGRGEVTDRYLHHVNHVGTGVGLTSGSLRW